MIESKSWETLFKLVFVFTLLVIAFALTAVFLQKNGLNPKCIGICF